MKKIKALGLFTGITMLAIGASATYAWFTSSADPVDLVVDTATIAIAGSEMTAELANKLPGESIGFVDWTLANNSTRESVVAFSLSAADITYSGGETFDAERKALLLEMLNDPANLTITGITSGENPVYTDQNTGYQYIWLDSGDQLDDGKFSITLTIPDELGGNVTISGGLHTEDPMDNRTADHPEEHGAIITLSCQAHAVQGTYAAINDVFGSEVADYFFQ